MNFANPKMLWLLLVIPPALAAFFWWSARARQRLLTQFIQARLLPSLTVGISITRQKIRLGCLVAAVVCLILALARPQWGFDWEEVKQSGLDIVVAIDTSKSMLAEDIAPNRLARAKLAALELMQRAKSDRLGLVAFAGNAFLQCPLTIDDAAFRQSVEALDVNTIPQGGTALAAAIETALTAYKEGDNYKVLVLFTDGEDHDSGAVEAAEKAAKEGLRIYTVGIGTAEGELLRVKDAQGISDYVRDEQGNVVKSHLDQKLLQQIASATEGGFYLPLRGAKVIDTLYDQGLATLPRTQHQEKLVRQYHERFYWPLAAAIVLLLVEMLFPERKPEKQAKHADGAKSKTPGGPPPIPASATAHQAQAPVPALQTPGSARSLSSLASLWSVAWFLGLLMLSPRAATASPSGALREYNSGNYDQALKEYERLLKKDKEDPRLHFNAGAAAYKNHQFDEAAKQFNATLSAPDLKLQSLGYYNEGNALFYLGEQSSDPKQRKEAWEKALQDYQSTLKLTQQDADAKHNYEFVKKKLEELNQQQQQSKQDKQDRNNKQQNQQQQDQHKQQQDQQNQQDQQDQQQKQQQAQQNQKQESSQQQAEQQKQQQQQQQQQAEQAAQKKQEQQQAQQADQKKQEQQQAQQTAAQKDKSDEKGQEAALAQMTPEQAKQLLDAQKDDEKLLQPKSTGEPSDHSRPFKDW